MQFQRQCLSVIILLLMLCCVHSGKRNRNKSGGGKHSLKLLKSHGGIGYSDKKDANNGLWPAVFNLAAKAVISANATCGVRHREEYCILSENIKDRCGICDDYATDSTRRHPINLALDDSNRWWQSPALIYGSEFEYVTVTVDLKQVYQIVYIILKAANSPRPGCWILERSLDGEHFYPWQYFARSDKECVERFGVVATKGKPRYSTDNDVICTTLYSKLVPYENGEVHVSLIQGRPGANETSPELLEFTKARYVRFRFMGLRGNMQPIPKWLTQDRLRDKKLFYSIRDIAIGGQCVCNGHAENCRHNVASGHLECKCQHNTCSSNCEKCCPLFNQRPWFAGSTRGAQKCVPCNCHGHAQSCRYDAEVDRAGLSLNVDGIYEGGGVCENCSDFTTGINCEKCLNGFFRPLGISPQDPRPCIKCECSDVGTSEEICVQYGSAAGTCKCKPGYTGPKCDSCAPGYRGYPFCESCLCDPNGVLESVDCEGECICKANVEGKYCEKCKPGYFGLSKKHPEGCLACFCSGVTSLCELALIRSKTIKTLQNWLLTDLKVTNFITPVTSFSSVFSVGNFEIPGVENLYWLAPDEYRGNKLESYGSTFVFNVQWVVMRGDTSGEPTIGPDIVLVGANGLQIGYGDGIYSAQRMSFEIPLNETGWYIIPSEIKDITTRMSKSDYNNGPVTRLQFLSVLTNIKYILLRGSFHTDQIEALLENAVMSYGNEQYDYETGSVEKCSCPSGYTGLSCESCSFGYVRIITNSSADIEEGYCAKCDCNGHSETCNALTGECFCQHNTIGEKCERCAVGYYGNPLRGTSDDCKKCACPLENPENNFSPGCQLDDLNLSNQGGYVCTQCPTGWTGDHCEICDHGFYGDPLEVGNGCKPCDCKPCDRKTGQCLSCRGNTEGWKCEKCKANHYGDPTTSNCKACECDPIGSESKRCDPTTGQCVCRERFVGRTCDQCEAGYGNVTALCPPCSCNSIGSKSGLCNTHTGICDCLPGVDGFRCDTCQNFHWGFSTNGCQACNCDPNGSKYSSCDPTTGNCICKTHYEGRTCDSCKPGYWKTLKKDCIKCHCNEFGALDSFCHQETGQCHCKSGVTGQNCDQCLSNYYGNVEAGCIECEPCTKKGHVCGKGGKCVCPTLTIGRECDRCTLNSWGYEFGKGCTACNCSQSGSTSLQCDRNSGICLCKVGYEGTRCERCSFGYYGYPNCKKCFCNAVGTLETECHDGDCQCNEDGSCNCKENVAGSKCNRCKEGTFGLSKEHPKGCKECFCFGRSSHCVDTKYNWDKIRFEKGIENNEPISSDTISLPERFLGDLTASYDGYLSVNGSGGKFLVFLTGNGISLKSDISSNELRLNEKSWRVTSGPILYDCRTTLTRKCFLVVLQKVTSVVIQGQDMEIVEVLLDSAKPYIPYNRTSHSIEKCDCPPEYTGLSCQDPSQGYYRFYKSEQEISESDWIDNIIGVAKRCDCNGQSFECDPNNGYCANCANNTSGFHCESCASGYYQDFLGNCQACLCPSELDNNAESCVAKKHGFVCHCKTGYTGSKCEYCKDSYFRDIKTNKCVPCDCNLYGSRSSICNEYGFCECKHGFHGDKCNQCKNPREFIKEGVCTPCDECSQILFKEIDLLYNTLDSVADQFKDGLKPPWKVLHSLRSRYKTLSKEFNYKRNRANDILRAGNIDKLDERTQSLQDQCDILGITSNETLKQAETNYKQSSHFRDELKAIKDDIEKLITQLRDFGKSHINAEEALKQAVRILKTMRRHTQQQINEVEAFNQPILDYCNKVAETVHNLYREPITLPCDDLAQLNVKLDEIEFMTKESEDTAAIAADQLDQNRIAMMRLKEAIMRFNDLKRVMDKNVQDVSDGIKDTREKINELELMLDAMENFDFSEWDRFETGILDLEDKLPSLNDLVQRASEHAKKLKKTVEDRVRILDFNKGETAKINGSQAYSKIIDGVMEARKTANRAQEILQKALKIINSSDGDSLRGRAFSEFAESDRLRHRITIMRDITNELMSKQKGVESFKGKLIDYTRTNNNLDRQVQSTENDITSKEHLVTRLHNAIKNSTDVIDSMRKIERDLPKLNISVQYDLFNQKKRYEATRDEAEKAIDKAKIDVAEAINKVNELLKRNNSIGADKVKNNQSSLDVVASKIAELRKKVLYARQTAETINVAVGLSNCSMIYTSPIPQTAVFRNMIISFKCVNCQLIKWRRPGLNIQIVNGKASLLLDDMSISTGKATMDKVEKVLLVERVGSLLRMKYDDGNRWESAQIGDTALIVEPTDVFEVGDGNPADNFTKVNKISINDHNIGMWKFAETHGACKGQPRTTKEQDGARPFYSGIGYAKYASSTAMPQEFYFTFSLSTFDENSLVYLAQENERPTAFISLTLEDGYAKLDVRHNSGQSVEIKNLEKINDGRKHSVVLAMKHDSYALKQYYTLEIDNNVRNNSVTHNVSLPKPHVFRIKKSLHYVGGIPPTLKLENINFKPRSFLGFIDYESKLTDKTISSGVTQKTGELQLYNAWFKGNGTLHLTFPAKRLESVSFFLRPLIANAAILDIKNLGTVTLSNNLLQINLVNGEHYLVNEDMSVTNNDYNDITITINKSKIKLSVNRKNQEFTRTKTARVFKGNQLDVTIGSMDGFHSFYGGISDITVNSENIPFNYTTVQGFSNVEIGREEPLIHLNKPTTITLKGLSPSVINFTNTMQSTQGCATTANYATDPTAVNFGDQLDSYIRIKTNVWRKDFMFEFEFRTLHSSGMLFISVGSTSPPQYHFLELKDGMIAFHVKGKRKKIPKNWPITFQKKVNDGEWHNLKLIKKNGKRVHMWLDGEAKKPLRIPRTNVQGEIFFGNVPKNYIVNRELKDKIRPFRGCINELKINGELWLLGKNTSDVLYNNIRQCFPKIEEGAYFGGDAYAIYKEGFRINKILDISFQFRTAEQNGILITVSNEANYPALSIELQSGAVVMTVDLGNGMQTNVTNNLDSNYALCNNMWHNVTAMYSSSELTVNVDGIRKIWVQNDINSLMDEIDAPLYIGGLPDNAAVGTLKTRENFKGCIKNLMIENELKDWSHMEELNSVLINSCPVVPLANNS